VLIAAIFIGGTAQGAGSLFPPPWDKLVHICTFGVMLLIAKVAFPNTNINALFLLTLAIGGADEIHQIYIPGGSAGLDDFIADFCGATLGLAILKLGQLLHSLH